MTRLLLVAAVADAGDHVFNVAMDRVNIKGFAVVGVIHDYKAGIHLDNADHCNISENHASDSDRGIL